MEHGLETGKKSTKNPLTLTRAKELGAALADWEMRGRNHCLHRHFGFSNFDDAMGFFNDVANLAQKEKHFPEIKVNFNEVTVKLCSDPIRGLSEDDFLFASKLNRVCARHLN